MNDPIQVEQNNPTVPNTAASAESGGSATSHWLQCLPVAAAFLNRQAEFKQVNQLFADLLRSDELFLRGKLLSSFWDERQFPLQAIQDAIAQGHNLIDQELYLKGRFYVCALRVINHPEFGADTISLVCTEVTRYKRRERVLQLNNQRLQGHLATDSLTGVRNRVALTQMLHDLAQQQLQCNVSLLMIDIDDFKQYNLSQNYSQGDGLLKSIAQLLQQFIDPEYSQVYRVHSAGFWVSLHSASAWSAYTLAERLRLAVYQQNYEFEQGIDARVTVSIVIHSATAQECANLNRLEKQLQQGLMDVQAQTKNQSLILARPETGTVD